MSAGQAELQKERAKQSVLASVDKWAMGNDKGVQKAAGHEETSCCIACRRFKHGRNSPRSRKLQSVVDKWGSKRRVE